MQLSPEIRKLAQIDTPLMRREQVTELEEEKARISRTLSPEFAAAHPSAAAMIQDRSAMFKSVRQINETLAEQAPKPYEADEIDAAVKAEAELRSQWMQGMPTQEEMRRNPAGAVGKNQAWDKRAKPKVMPWKNIRLRLEASGALPDAETGPDVANIERYRPSGGAQQMNLDNAQITAKEFFLPPAGAEPAAVMSDAESDWLKREEPILHAKIGLADNATRARILDAVREALAAEEPVELPAIEDVNKLEWGQLKGVASKLGVFDKRLGKPQMQQAVREALKAQQ